MLYVGTKQKTVEGRVRQAILQTKVGKTGYVYVLGGRGEDRGIFENALEGLFQTSIEGRFLSANPATAQIMGYASSEELISSVTEVRQEIYDRPADRDALVKTLLAHGEASGVEIQYRRKDGTRIWVSISAILVNAPDGRPTLIEGFLSDISTLKNAEEARAESRNYLDEIINAVADPMFFKDRQHRWVLVNYAMCAFLGRKREDLLGKSDYDYVPKQEADVFWAKDELVLATGEENINEEKAKAMGIREFILKPLNMQTLSVAIRKIF